MTVLPGAGTGGAGAHPGGALSALVDGELDTSAVGPVQAHLAGCPACGEELQQVRAARRSLRSLPAVEPPPGFFDLAVARVRADGAGLDQGDHAGMSTVAPIVPRGARRRSWAGVASAAAGVALFALAVAGADPGSYRPAVDANVGRHVATRAALAGGVGGAGAADVGGDPLQSDLAVTATTAVPRNPRTLPAPYPAPARLDGGYRLVEAFAHPEGLQLLYRNGRHELSVFQAAGHLDRADLPPEGRTIDIAGTAGWRWESEEVDGRVVVFERDGLVVTVIGDESAAAVLKAARSVPAPRALSMMQRLDEAATEVFEAFSP